MAKGISNTSRTLEYLRSQGWEAAIVERFLPYAGKFGQRKDMFGFGDIVAMGEGKIWAIQSCGQAFAEHHKKLTEDGYVAPLVERWLRNKGKLLLVGWRKVKLKRGGKAMRWSPRIREYKMVESTAVTDFERVWLVGWEDKQ